MRMWENRHSQIFIGMKIDTTSMKQHLPIHQHHIPIESIIASLGIYPTNVPVIYEFPTNMKNYHQEHSLFVTTKQ